MRPSSSRSSRYIRKNSRSLLPLIPILLLTLTLSLPLSLSSCAKQAAQAPVPGQLNTFDAYAYRVLSDAQAAINSLKSSISSGSLTETATLKTILNQTITDYNVAEVAYQAWHAAGGTGSTTPVSSAITKVQNDIASLPTAATAPSPAPAPSLAK